MKSIYFLLVIGIFQLCPAFSQNQTNFWHFGLYCGLDFSNGTPAVITNSPLTTTEGTASISDAAGNLLFFTDGVNVWNRSNIVMPNGTGLLGDPSTTQVMIIPGPGNSQLYFIFTLDDESGPDGLNYSTVDMSFDGGLGDVTVKNTHLKNNMTEKIAAVYHCNNHDIWVMTHETNSDEFNAWLVTDSGVAANPVVSNTGTAHTDIHGQMKFKSDGTGLGCVMGLQGLAEVFNFDNVTGLLTSPITLSLNNNVYGIEFSPDNSRLYVSYYDAASSKVGQFDLLNSDVQGSLINLATLIAETTIYRSLQLGPDGKIYIAESNSPFICIINSPNIQGPGSNFQNDAINADPSGSGNIVMMGLPGFIQSFFHPLFPNIPCSVLDPDFTSSDMIICPRECISFTYSGSPATSWQWTFSGANDIFSLEENPQQICYFTAGAHMVSLMVSDGIVTDTVFKIITVLPLPIVDAGPNITVVDGSTINLSATGNLTSYSWSPPIGLSDPEIPNPLAMVNETTIYYVSGVDLNNCPGIDSVLITASAAPVTCGEIFIPSAFSPDNNGENDFECVIGKCITEMTFAIYSRWGEKVFESNDQSICWDGTYKGQPLNSAEFVYILKAVLISGDEVIKEGNISLIR